MDDRVWYLAAGTKTVGPMTAARVRERIETGKVTPKTKAWREGMPEWLPLGEVRELGGAGPAAEEEALEPVAVATATLEPPPAAAPARPAPPALVETKTPPKRPTPSKLRAAATPPPPAPPAPPRVAFVAPYRIERADIWSAFNTAFEGPRVRMALLTLGGAVGGAVLAAAMGALAAEVHMLLALPFALLAAFLMAAITLTGTGALAYQARRRLVDGITPPVREAVAFAREHLRALMLVPFALSAATSLPVIALVLLSLVLKVPYAGPVVTGLIYGVHIALGAATLFVILAAGLSWTLAPTVIAFEETGVMATIRGLLDFVKRSGVRYFLWSWKPKLGLAGVALALLVAGAAILAIPILLHYSMIAPQLYFAQDGVPGLTAGVVTAGVWVALFLAGILAMVLSLHGAITSLLYVAGRPGNDDLISRDTWLARKQ